MAPILGLFKRHFVIWYSRKWPLERGLHETVTATSVGCVWHRSLSSAPSGVERVRHAGLQRLSLLLPLRRLSWHLHCHLFPDR